LQHFTQEGNFAVDDTDRQAGNDDKTWGLAQHDRCRDLGAVGTVEHQVCDLEGDDLSNGASQARQVGGMKMYRGGLIGLFDHEPAIISMFLECSTRRDAQ
jgi:hypothetical protein